MADGLRDIRAIEPSYAVFFFAALAIVFILAAVYIIIRLSKRQKPVDYLRIWKGIKDRYGLVGEKDYRLFYANLNVSFREFAGLFLNKDLLGYTLKDVLDLLPAGEGVKRDIEDSLERIYRGDYYYLEVDFEKYRFADLAVIDRAVRELALKGSD